MDHPGMSWALTHHKYILFSPKFKMKMINFELIFEFSLDLRTKLWFPASAKTVVATSPPGGYFSERPPEVLEKNLPNAPKSTETNILLFTTKSQSFDNPLGVTMLTNKTKPAGIDSKKPHSYKVDIFCPI